MVWILSKNYFKYICIIMFSFRFHPYLYTTKNRHVVYPTHLYMLTFYQGKQKSILKIFKMYKLNCSVNNLTLFRRKIVIFCQTFGRLLPDLRTRLVPDWNQTTFFSHENGERSDVKNFCYE